MHDVVKYDFDGITLSLLWIGEPTSLAWSQSKKFNYHAPSVCECRRLSFENIFIFVRVLISSILFYRAVRRLHMLGPEPFRWESERASACGTGADNEPESRCYKSSRISSSSYQKQFLFRRVNVKIRYLGFNFFFCEKYKRRVFCFKFSKWLSLWVFG